MTNEGKAYDERPLVKVRLSAVGSLPQKEQMAVILLVPDEGAKVELDDSISSLPLLFPVVVNDKLVQSYFLLQRYQAEREQQPDTLELAFMHAFGINVHSVVIGESGDAVLVRMFYTDAEDKERIMYTNVSRAVLFALPNKIPIYVEELLLIKLSKVIRLNFQHLTGTHQTDVEQAALSLFIKRGDKPTDVDPSVIHELLKELSETKKEELIQLAIKHESYEWAQLFSEAHPNNEKE